MVELFNQILYRPLFNLAVYMYSIIPGSDLGIAIISLTVIIRIVFLPLSMKTIRSQRQLASLGPKIDEIKEKHKNDKMAQSAAVMQLYKEHNINPLSGCFPILVQIPILIALYRVFLNISRSEGLEQLYGFITVSGEINKFFMGFLDLTAASPFLAICAGLFQYIHAKQSASLTKGTNAKTMAAFSKQMLYFFPIMIIIISWNLPAGLTLYWVTTMVFSIFEHLYIRRKHT